MAENFYLVLGISRDADLTQIRGAYRRLVKQLHPDISESPPDRFIELQEAYETLSNPQTRRAHDERLADERGLPVAVRIERTHPRRVTRSRRPPPPFAGMADLFSAIDEMVGGFVPGLFNAGRQSARQKDLYVEMQLSSDEAEAGGLYPLTVPVKQHCPECGGTGARGTLLCPTCDGGTLDYHEIRIAIPAGVHDGQRAQLSLEDVGLPDVQLNVLVLVR